MGSLKYSLRQKGGDGPAKISTRVGKHTFLTNYKKARLAKLDAGNNVGWVWNSWLLVTERMFLIGTNIQAFRDGSRDGAG